LPTFSIRYEMGSHSTRDKTGIAATKCVIDGSPTGAARSNFDLEKPMRFQTIVGIGTLALLSSLVVWVALQYVPHS
jgi:hypothetical protein